MYEKVKTPSSKRNVMIELNPKMLFIAIIICSILAGISSYIKADGRDEIICGEE
jgi:hypothetical protein